MKNNKKTTFGIVGGIGPLSGADLFFKFVKATPASDDSGHFNVILEQHPLSAKNTHSSSDSQVSRRKLHIYDVVRQLVKRDANAILLCCFISHTFIDELAGAFKVPILNMMEGLKSHIQNNHSGVKTIGVLTSDYARQKKLFESYFPSSEFALVYPDPDIQKDCLMEAVYGNSGIKAGKLSGKVIEKLETACRHLVSKGAQLILPGFTEIPVVLDFLQNKGPFNIIDTNQVYADWAVRCYPRGRIPRPLKIGILGGLGPSATIDLMNKIVKNTPAGKDQEHLQMIVEHDPKIPDRTAHLLEGAEDPTIPLYTGAKNLERQGADFIVVPCNTAHAFIERIQRHLTIPIINMVQEVVTWITRSCPGARTIGLLATSGTIETGIYHKAFQKTEFKLITPDKINQEQVMQSIYGNQGVKAGFTHGKPRQLLLKAVESLVDRGASVVILGCTELPLLLEENSSHWISGKNVTILDPTNILSKKCVALVLDSQK